MSKYLQTKIPSWVLMALLVSCSANSQNHLVVHVPSADSEADYIWRNIQDIPFFEQNNYQLSLPQGQVMEELKAKARKQQLSDEDYERLKSFMQDSVYQASSYAPGYEKIERQLEVLNKMVAELKASPWQWGFKKFDTYQINCTLYGPGGSYNPDEGSLIIYTTPQGQFKNYANPANTIIHEIVHIGIEEAIIQKYNIPHRLKERIVDKMVSLCFQKYLPNYTIQDMGEYRIDAYLQSPEDIQNLDKYVQEIMKGE